MGRQTRLQYDLIDELALVQFVQQSEPWACTPRDSVWSSDPAKRFAWQPLPSRIDGDLLIAPARLALRLGVPETIVDTDGHVIEWLRSAAQLSTAAQCVEVGKSRLWLGASPFADRELAREYARIARFVAAFSPCVVNSSGLPIYVGPHLVAEVEGGVLRPVWPNGKKAELLPNPRFNPQNRVSEKRTGGKPRRNGKPATRTR